MKGIREWLFYCYTSFLYVVFTFVSFFYCTFFCLPSFSIHLHFFLMFSLSSLAFFRSIVLSVHLSGIFSSPSLAYRVSSLLLLLICFAYFVYLSIDHLSLSLSLTHSLVFISLVCSIDKCNRHLDHSHRLFPSPLCSMLSFSFSFLSFFFSSLLHLPASCCCCSRCISL